MGSVELKDQVAGLQKAISTFDFIDESRVAITGWSYGGYLSLLGIAMYPHIFKVYMYTIIGLVSLQTPPPFFNVKTGNWRWPAWGQGYVMLILISMKLLQCRVDVLQCCVSYFVKI